MIEWFSEYLRLVKRFKTPLVFLLDRRYKKGTIVKLTSFLKEVELPSWIAEDRDCDDIAAILKGEASKQRMSWIGVVIGWHNGVHMWNMASLETGDVNIEPQTKVVNPSGYHAFVVVK